MEQTGQTKSNLGFVILAAAAAMLIGGGIASRLFGSSPGAPIDVSRLNAPTLEREAEQALAAIKARQPTDRRPASYDAVMRPIASLLALAKFQLTKGEQDDAKQTSASALGLSRRALAMAREEPPMSRRDYRFPAFIAEACEYIATVDWLRLQRTRAAQTGLRFPSDDSAFRPEDLDPIRAYVDEGIAADDSRAELWLLSGRLFKAAGLRPQAVNAFRNATDRRPANPAPEEAAATATAWNELGLALWDLRDFGAAEEALAQARIMAAKAPTGEVYTTVCFNLGDFHQSRYHFYTSGPGSGDADAKTKAAHHAVQARSALTEFLRGEPKDSPYAVRARGFLEQLGDGRP